MKRTRERAIEIVAETLVNRALRTDGVSVSFEDDGYDDIATFKVMYICGIEHLVAGIEDVGNVEIADINGYQFDEEKKVVYDFVKTYFDTNDYMKNVKEFFVRLEE